MATGARVDGSLPTARDLVTGSSLVTSILLAGVVYPLVCGSLGGVIDSTLAGTFSE